MTYDPTDHLAEMCSALQGVARRGGSVEAPLRAVREGLGLHGVVSLVQWRKAVRDALEAVYEDAAADRVIEATSERDVACFDAVTLLRKAVAHAEAGADAGKLSPDHQCCETHDAGANGRVEAYEDMAAYLRGMLEVVAPAIDSSQEAGTVVIS